MAAGVKNNVLHQTGLLSAKSAVIKEFAHSKRIQIVPAVYSLTTGKVEWLDPKLVSSVKEDPKVGHDDKKVALIEVTVPSADAKVWIDGAETKSRGVSRTYESVGLESGRDFKYQIKASWLVEGKEVVVERTVTFQAGKTVKVDFTK